LRTFSEHWLGWGRRMICSFSTKLFERLTFFKPF
jgi:hypothetical protein